MPPGPHPVPPEAIVIRGGVMERKSLEKAVEKSFAEEEIYALSVYCHPSNPIEEVARMAGLPYRKMRAASAADLYDAGYRLDDWRELDGHADLVFPDAPTGEDWERVESIFGPPIANPHPRTQP
jgi:hypothetical protein